MANRLKRTINAAGMCMLVASAPLTSTAQTVPESTPATVVASVLTPPVLLGILIFAFPGAGAVSIAWILGAYTAASGMVLIALAIRLRTLTLA